MASHNRLLPGLSIPGGRLGIGNVASESRLGSGLGLTLSSSLGILVLATQPRLHPVSTGHTWIPAHSLTSHEEEGAGQGQASMITQEGGHQICANASPSLLADSLLSLSLGALALTAYSMCNPPNQGPNLRPLHRQADFHPPYHQSPEQWFLKYSPRPASTSPEFSSRRLDPLNLTLDSEAQKCVLRSPPRNSDAWLSLRTTILEILSKLIR